MTLIGLLIIAAGIIGIIVFSWLQSGAARKREELRRSLKEEGLAADEVTTLVEEQVFTLPKKTPMAMGFTILIGAAFAFFNSIWFYAEPGYIYHVRTITGEEKVVSDVGYNSYLFGRYNAWKRAMTVQAVTGGGNMNAETDSTDMSASVPPLNITFLDQVDADSEATVRFSIPTDKESFLNLAHEYRSPENLLRTALLPAFKETLQSTASLMSAEDYYSGGRTEFNSEFENQISDGIYVVRREEVQVQAGTGAKATANAARVLGEPMGFVVSIAKPANDQAQRPPGMTARAQ